MFLVYNLNIMIYRYDSFLFNYHATIINQLFNHHFSRFTRNRYTPKVLKTECFQESISLFCRNTLLFYLKTPDVFLKMPVRALFTPPSESYRNPGLQITEIRISTDKSNYISDNKPYSTRKKAITPMIVQS